MKRVLLLTLAVLLLALGYVLFSRSEDGPGQEGEVARRGHDEPKRLPIIGPLPVRDHCKLHGTLRVGRAAKAKIHADRLENDVEAIIAQDGKSFDAEISALGRVLIVAVDREGRSAERYAECKDDGHLEVVLGFDRAIAKGAEVRGRCIYLENGAPVPSATVRARLRSMTSRHLGLEEKLAWSALTGEDGAFEARVPEGEYLVRCTKDMDEGEDQEVVLVNSETQALDLVVEVRAAIQGRVVDENGEGVAGAYVSGRGARLAGGASIREASSDREGRFRLMGLPVGPVKIDASLGDRFGEAEAVACAALPYREVTLVLAAGGMTIQGRITGNDGPPLEGASVGLEVLDRRSARAPIERHARTDGDGHYLLGGLVPGHYAVFASQPGYLSRRIEIGEVSGPYTFDLELFKACPRSARVLPAEPKSAVELTVEPQDGTSPNRTFSGVTGADIEVRDMAGLVNLYARTFGTKAKTATRALDLCAAIGEIELDLDRSGAGAIEVTVESKDGRRLSGVEVEVSRSALSAKTDAQGRAVFEGLPPKRYWIHSGDNWSDGIDVEPEERAEVTLTVDRREGEVTGVVVAQSRPIEGAAVRATCRDSAWQTTIGNAPVVARSDGRGQFAFEPKNGGLCLVRAEHPTEGRSEPTTLKAGGMPAELELRALGSIAGRVLEAGGAASIARYTLTVRAEGRGGEADVRTLYVDEVGGRFSIEGLAPGMLSLYATAPGGGKGHTEVELSPGESMKDVEIRVLEGGTVIGRLIGGSVPIPGVRVFLRSAASGNQRARDDDAYVKAETVTDADGRFTLKVSGGDALRLFTSAERYYPWGSRPFDLVTDGRPTDLGDIPLTARGGAEEKEGGIGIQFAPDPKGVRVVRLLDESPARDVGIDIGDVITVIDGVPAGRLPLVNWIVALRGKVGTPVVLAIERGTQAVFTVTVIRRNLGLDAVPSEPLE